MFGELHSAGGDGQCKGSGSSQDASPDRRREDPNEQPLVLVVDDDENTREAVQTLLELEGYRAAGAGDGQDALDLLEHGLRPGLILLDLNMPRMDGVAFLRAQRRHPALAPIPVIVCSGCMREEEKKALGAVMFLGKPTAVDHLLDLVHQQCPLNP